MPQQDNQSEIIAAYMDLFSKCEAMRPNVQVKTRGVFAGQCSEIIDDDNSTRMSHEISLNAALALCRCAVEDWLIKRRFGFNQLIPTAGGVCVHCGGNDDEIFNGPTIHHALISAASVVLDAQEGAKE